jgi:hypothetical protein
MRPSDMRKLTLALIVLAVALPAASPTVRGASQKFYKDDPIAREPETQDASNVQAWDINLSVDLLSNLFVRPG